MTLLNTHAELDDLGQGKFRHVQHIRQIAYREGGTLRSIVSDWVDSGIPARPHAALNAPIMVTAGEDGMRRIHPTRELDRYIEIGAPFVKTGGVWGQVSLGTPTRNGNRLTWTRPQANMYVDFGGHLVKLAILLKGGYVPEDNMIAFPVGMQGFTRQGLNLLVNGTVAARLDPPVMIDFADQLDVRPIDSQIANVNGQPYWVMTLPDLTGMAQPVIDPTLSLQPDAAAGKDAFISRLSPAENWGVAVYNLIGLDSAGSDRHGLIQFDISSIPALASVLSATLTQYCSVIQSTAQTINAYPLLVDWDEGASNGGADDVSWGERKSGVVWSTSGGSGSGTDRSATLGWTLAGTTIATAGTYHAVDVLSNVASWVAGAANYGWVELNGLTTGSNNQIGLDSSDNTTAAFRPELEVVYTLGSRRSIFDLGVGRGVMRGAR